MRAVAIAFLLAAIPRAGHAASVAAAGPQVNLAAPPAPASTVGAAPPGNTAEVTHGATPPKPAPGDTAHKHLHRRHDGTHAAAAAQASDAAPKLAPSTVLPQRFSLGFAESSAPQFHPAPVPDEDHLPPAGGEAPSSSLDPHFFHERNLDPSDGFARGSSAESGEDFQRTPIPGVKLSIPVQ